MKLINQSFLYLSARLLSGLLGLTTTILLTHLLHPAEYGVYGLAMTIMLFISSTSFDALGLSFARFAVDCKGDIGAISTFVIAFLVLVAVNGALIALLSLARIIPPDMQSLFWVSYVLACLYSLFELSARYEMANFAPYRYLTMNLVRTALVLVLATGLAYITESPFGALAGTGLGIMIGAMVGSIPIAQTRIREFQMDFARSCGRYGLPLAASLLLEGLTLTGVRWLLQSRGSLESLGHFTAAYMVVQNSLILIAAGVGGAGFQFAVRSFNAGDKPAWRRQMLDIASLLLALMAPAALGMAATADDLAQIFLTAEYAQEFAALLPWMAFGAFVSSIRWFYVDLAFQLAEKPERQMFVATVAATLANGLAYLLIPHYGAKGASIAYALAMPVSLLYAYFTSRRVCALPIPYVDAAKVIACCGLMYLAVRLVPGPPSILALLLKIVIGALTYFGAGVALNLLGSRGYLLRALARADLDRSRVFRPIE